MLRANPNAERNTPMAAPSPVAPLPVAERRVNRTASASDGQARRKQMPLPRGALLRSIPLLGMGAVIAAGISAPAGIGIGAAIVIAEIALGALSIAVWFPRKK